MLVSNLVERMTILLHHPAVILLYYLRHVAETVVAVLRGEGVSEQVWEDAGSLSAASSVDCKVLTPV